jgi:hypothetical protein
MMKAIEKTTTNDRCRRKDRFERNKRWYSWLWNNNKDDRSMVIVAVAVAVVVVVVGLLRN